MWEVPSRLRKKYPDSFRLWKRNPLKTSAEDCLGGDKSLAKQYADRGYKNRNDTAPKGEYPLAEKSYKQTTETRHVPLALAHGHTHARKQRTRRRGGCRFRNSFGSQESVKLKPTLFLRRKTFFCLPDLWKTKVTSAKKKKANRALK